jgi:hypothetical protein
MRRRLAMIAVVAGALAFAVRARSDAPTDQYGVYAPSSPTVRDQLTRLEWWRATETASFDSSVMTCGAHGQGFRLPTLRELLTLVDEEPHKIYSSGRELPRFIDRNAFPDTSITTDYLTSTPKPGGRYWTVSFATGEVSSLPSGNSTSIRCVRVY